MENISTDKILERLDALAAQVSVLNERVLAALQPKRLARIGEVAGALGYTSAYARELYDRGKWPAALPPINAENTKCSHLRWRWSDVENYLVTKASAA